MRGGPIAFVLVHAIAAALSACASAPTPSAAERAAQLRERLARAAVASSTPTRPIAPAATPASQPTSAANVAPPPAPPLVSNLASNARVTLDFRSAPLPAVLDAITRASGIDFILDRDIRLDARVTLHLRNASVADAIELVARAQQLARHVVDPRTVLLYPNTPDKQREHQPQAIRMFHLAHADAKSTAAMLRTMLRLKDVHVDERANLLVLREPASVVEIAERLVALLDVPDGEVMLELEVLEVTAARLGELGLRVPDSVSLVALAPAGPLTVDALRALNGSRIGVGISPLVLNLRRELGDATVLANPRIRTRNREKAHVLIGDKVPVITSTASATGFVSENVSYLDVGLKLEVEPTVAPDGDVQMRVALEVSSISREVRSAAGTLAYQIGTRHAGTVLRLADGETQLLAGLISQEDRHSANRLPGIGDLPLAGRLFSSERDDRRRTELVLAITPRVLRPAPRSTAAEATLPIGTELDTGLRRAPAQGIAGTDPEFTSADAGARPLASTGDAGAPIARPAATAIPTLYWQSPAGAHAGTVFTATLGLEAATELRSATTELAFDPALLEVLDVTDGELMRAGGITPSFTHDIDAAGRIRIVQQRGGDADASGSGALVRLRLRAKKAGTTALRVVAWKAHGMAAEPANLPMLHLELR